MEYSKFYKKYNGTSVADWCTAMSPEPTSFFRTLKNTLKSNAEQRNINLISFNIGHYDCSGYFKRNNKYVYFSFDIPRGGRTVNLDKSDHMFGFLYRTAEGPTDYKGGPNHFSNYLSLMDNIDKLLKSQEA